jgi:uncharacterized protein YdeI (YjbR/CyaY-like superfamily)
LKEAKVFYPKCPADWRRWLEKHQQSKKNVWLVFYTKASGKDSLTWSEAVDVAICFGWIDSKKIKIDEITSHQYFSKRKPKSPWSRINKEKVERLTKAGLMTEAGFKCVEIAKANGSWNLINDAENLIVPDDLAKAFSKLKGSAENFGEFAKSSRRAILAWLILAKRAETRQRRIDEIAKLAAQGKKPKQF